MKQLIAIVVMGISLSSCVKTSMPVPSGGNTLGHSANRRSGDLPPAKTKTTGSVIRPYGFK